MGMVLMAARVAPDHVVALRGNTKALDELFDGELCDVVDFDKAWHVLHYIFTGSVEETDASLSLLRCDAETLVKDFGSGGANYLNPQAVAAFREALKAFSDQQIIDRFREARLVKPDVYGDFMFDGDEEEELEYLMQSIPDLRRLTDRCFETGSGLVVAIS